MGVMSRKVLPVCGNLCFFCPSMRARSRQPVKRYKKFLAEIFPRSQDAEPNDRKIGKLCEYAAKNPLRIPKITEFLEQRFYKDLRNQQFGSVKVVICIYRKLLSSCKEQMPLFANSLLGIIRTLLEQTGQNEMRILGCIVLVDLINSQTDSTYMFNLESFIPALCQLAQEVGDDEKGLRFRSAGLQALAFMVWFMGEHSHVSLDFDNIISVTLENYMDLPVNPETLELGASEVEDHSLSLPKVSKKDPSTLNLINFKPELDSKEGISKSPSYWSRICLQNMARLAKEATTVRRVLEPLFQCFDSDNHWSSESGLAYSVLTYMQMLLEESGLNAHLLLSILVKHLDHKSIVKQPAKQINIVKVTIKIAENAKEEASDAITGAIADLIKHLRKCMQYSAKISNPLNGVNCYSDLQLAIENCIRQLSIKVGDVGPILDMMAVALESIPTNGIAARMMLSSVYRTAEIVSSIPNVSYHQKTFPDALFHQLLVAMAHPDHETRVMAHHVFSLLLMPSLICPWRVKSGSYAIQDDVHDKTKSLVGAQVSVDCAIKFSFPDQSYSFKRGMVDKEAEPSTFRLSSHQVSLLLSAIWMQAICAENTPGTFEAMAHTYNIALLFTRYKNSGKKTLFRCFQLAFSLRGISLDNEVVLQPSRKRSLFTMATCMLIFSARAGNVPELIPLIKSSLTRITSDPYLKLVEDIRLHSVYAGKGVAYGSEEDEVAALKSLSTIVLGDRQLRETVISHLIAKFSDLSEDEMLDMRKQMLEGFSADDLYPMGAPSFMETSRACSPLAQTESHLFDEIMAEDGLTDEEAFSEPNGSQSDRKTSSSITSLDVLSVNQLLDSVLETARHVANLPVSSTPIPYDQIKNECEALVTGKQQKMSVLQSFKIQQDSQAMVLFEEKEKINSTLSNVKFEISEPDLSIVKMDQVTGGDKQLLSSSLRCAQQESFRLPPSSPYDKFLKAAGC